MRRATVGAYIAAAVLFAAGAFPAPTQADDRKVVFECPCSAEFAPDGDGGEGTLTLHFGLRNHRDVRSAGLMVRVLHRNEDGELSTYHAQVGDILPQSPLWEHGVPAASVIRGLSHAVRYEQPQMGETFAVELLEANGDLSSSDPNAQVHGVASGHEWLTLWPVPSGGTDAATRYVDILTDADSDGVGDVNERIAGTDPDDPASTPGASEVDVLWLYQASLAAPDAVPEYHHAAVVANAVFVDNGTNLGLRSVGFVAVDDGDIDEHGYIKEEPLEELMGRHGADVLNFWYDDQDGIADPCPEGVSGCAGLGDWRQRGGWSPTSSYVTDPWGPLITHELGHVMGLAHSARQAEWYGSFRWSRGHYIGGWTPNGILDFGTIMSYGTSPGISAFSTPTSGRCQPLGACGLPATHLHGADAVRSLDLIRFQVADVRGGKPDSDGDGFVDAVDAFPNDPGDWADLDGDGTGDKADPDADGDGRANADDAFPRDADEWADLDGDGLGDNADPDRDGDGVDNGDDLFPDDALDHADADGDGVGDNAQRLHPFRDANLRAVVERALGKAEGDPVSDAEMAGLGALEADDADVSDLTGLELATGLTKLRLGMARRRTQDGGVADLSPLAGLEALETVGLAVSPRLAGLSPLAGLRNLWSLRLAGLWSSPSQVSDLRALESLPLADLSITHAAVSDASPLSGLAQLAFLDLSSNRIGDISSLQGLSQLRHLSLRANDVSDISPLAGLAQLAFLDLSSNRIGDISSLGELTGLSHLYLGSNRIADISSLGELTGLSYLDLGFNLVADTSALAALAGLRTLLIGGNPLLSFRDFLTAFQPGPGFHLLSLQRSGIDDLAPLAEFMERAGARAWDLHLATNPFTDLSPLVRPALWDGGGSIDLTYVRLDPEAAEDQIAELESIGVTVYGYDRSPASKPVDVPDDRLRGLLQEAAVASSARGVVDDPVTPDSAGRVRQLHAFGQGIADLKGLEAATGLEYAHLASNRISDLSPLLGLKALKGVGLDGNPLSEDALNRQVPELMARVEAAQCGHWEAACGTFTLNAVSWTPVAGGDGMARFRTGGYFSARLGVDIGQVSFSAGTDRPALRPSVSAEGALRIAPVRLAGPATVTVTAEAAGADPGADPAALDFLIVSPKSLPLFLADGAASGRHGFLRVVNHSGRAGEMRITAGDGSGAAFGPVELPLEGHQAIHLNSHDLENGNPAKGLRKGLGDGEGEWRLRLEGRLNAEALAYVRTRDGFVTAMHEVAPKADGDRELLFFNPGSNHRQESVLRLLNDGDEAGTVRITGIDDAGSEGGVVTVDLPAGASMRFTAAELEDGAAPGLSGALGDGTGKWRLRIEAGPDVTAMGLLETPTGHLANLSAPPPARDAGGIVRIPLFLSAAEPSREGFMRVVNRSGSEGAVAISAFDDMGGAYGPVSLSLGPREARHFNSGDLEAGNPAKGLGGSTGAGSGNWRLELDGGGLDFEALAYVRTNDGFVTAMHEAAPDAGGGPRIAFLNPGSNHRQESVLRLANPGDAPASITVTAIDDAGRAGGAPLTLELPAGRAVALTAKALEGGAEGLSGSMGDGRGKWRLCVEADRPVTAMSLLETPTGHLANMSASPDLFDCAEAD